MVPRRGNRNGLSVCLDGQAVFSNENRKRLSKSLTLNDAHISCKGINLILMLNLKNVHSRLMHNVGKLQLMD